MKKMMLTLASTVLFLIFLSSCGGPACPDIEQIKSDLLASNANCFNIDGDNLSLEIDDVKIMRRKTDKQYDEVCVAATLSNEQYAVEAEYTLSYSFYDVGGWCLDYLEETHHKSHVLETPLTDEMLETALLNQFTTCSITNRSQSTDSQGVFHDAISFVATIEYPYLTVSLNGACTFDFYDDYWHESASIEPTGFDWSNFIGTFIYEDTSMYNETAKINISDIVQISEKELQVTYSGSARLIEFGTTVFNESVESRTKILKIEYTTITVLGGGWNSGFLAWQEAFLCLGHMEVPCLLTCIMILE